MASQVAPHPGISRCDGVSSTPCRHLKMPSHLKSSPASQDAIASQVAPPPAISRCDRISSSPLRHLKMRSHLKSPHGISRCDRISSSPPNHLKMRSHLKYPLGISRCDGISSTIPPTQVPRISSRGRASQDAIASQVGFWHLEMPFRNVCKVQTSCIVICASALLKTSTLSKKEMATCFTLVKPKWKSK